MAKSENNEPASVEPEIPADSAANLDASSPYETEEALPKKNRTAWLKSRGIKIAAIATGGSLALGAAFVGGVVTAKTFGPSFGVGFAQSFDGEERQFPQAEGLQHDRYGEGNRPPRGFGDRDGDGVREFKVDTDGQTPATPDSTLEAPAPTATVTP
ncbi:MAG: hypothetical protein RIS82_75 [Actinomycetota bacterium]